jgi:ribonuclease Z
MALQLVVIGCGSATPTGNRISSSFALKKGNEVFLIDCSEGSQMRLKPYGIRMNKISRIFISHLHGDHYFGLVGLLSTFHLFGRKDKLHVYGHSLLKDIIDIQMKVGNTSLSYPLHFHEIEAEKHALIYEDNAMTIETFPLIHSIPTNGFLFKEKGRPLNLKKDFVQTYNPSVDCMQSVKEGNDFIDSDGHVLLNKEITEPSSCKSKTFAYCSDTIYTESIIPYIKGADLLYHEATFMDDMLSAAKDKLHTTASQAARIAAAAEVKTLLIGHYSARYTSIDLLLEEAKLFFPNTIAAEEGLVIEV